MTSDAERAWLTRLLQALMPEEVEEALGDVLRTSTVSWEPLGGRINNRGAVEVSGDPGRALIERVTNGIDAVLEAGFNAHQGIPRAGSPQEAARFWLDVPEGGLSRATTRERQLLAGRVEIRLLEGTGPNGRTVEIIDKGTGIPWEYVPSTILSLHESNKLQKHYLAGVYG